MDQRLTSRKFMSMAVAQLCWIALFQWGKLTEAGFIDLTQLTFGGYFIANVWAKKYTESQK